MARLAIKQISGSISEGGQLFMIASGSVSASVSTSPNELFLIRSGSAPYMSISSSSHITIFSDLFVIKNFSNNQKVFEVSGSVAKFPTHSVDPVGSIDAGSIWFTSSSFFVGLE